jgi:hypothetical protein
VSLTWRGPVVHLDTAMTWACCSMRSLLLIGASAASAYQGEQDGLDALSVTSGRSQSTPDSAHLGGLLLTI